jgi:hypothetical protein
LWSYRISRTRLRGARLAKVPEGIFANFAAAWDALSAILREENILVLLLDFVVMQNADIVTVRV